jgi:Transaldolase
VLEAWLDAWRSPRNGLPEALALRGKAAVANARLAHAAFEECINSPRWESLRADGAQPQRPLWASTGVKNPEYPPTLYVDELVTRGTVNTMPEKTIDAVAASGRITGDTVRGNYEAAEAVMRELERVGVDYDDVVKVLEDEGVEKFEASWNELLETVAAELRKA